MLVWTSWFVIGVLYHHLYCYLFTDINERKFKVTSKMVLLSVLFSLINYYTIINGLWMRPFIIHFCYILLIYFEYKPEISKAIITVVLIAILLMISELLFANIFLNTDIMNWNTATHSNYGILISNLIILGIAILLFHLPKVRNFFKEIVTWYASKKIINDVFLVIVTMAEIAIISYQCLGHDFTKSLLLMTNSFLFCFIIFICAYFNQKSYNGKLSVQYDKLIKYIQTCENLLNEKRKALHEYKNQLILIRDMVSTNRKAVNYINSLLNIEKSDEESIEYKWIEKLSNLPQNGLKGLIYYKVLQMKSLKVDLLIHISEELKQNKLWDICEQNLKDISRVIGVYIDNAIEAAKEAQKKYIIIDIELENNDILFSFSNTYKGNLDIEKIDLEGFSTRGKEKGYGLSLVKDILDKNKQLEQQREINGIYYVQKLLVKNEEQ